MRPGCRRLSADPALRTVASEFGEEAHGVAGWPSANVGHEARPDRLPDGRAWPTILVLIAHEGDADGLSATIASVVAQDYPEARHDVLADGAPLNGELAALSGPDAEYLLLLHAGDLLAPGALTALGFEAVGSGADRVAGLRVLFDRGVIGLDVIGDPSRVCADGTVPFTGGDVLLSREAVLRAGASEASGFDLVALWGRLEAIGASFVRIGRPVLLQHCRGARARSKGASLSIAALTDRGLSGGAGIAHRRLADALRLSGHRVTDYRLDAEAPPATAEWTDRFPRTEAAICGGGHDLVLAGNLHGATRGIDPLAHLGATMPVAAVLHDLFPLTGRCAFPSEGSRIATGCDAACPSADQYPQLAPNRIATAFAAKRAILSGPGAPLLLANSRWTLSTARALGGPDIRVHRIDLAFPTGVFRPPEDRAALRRSLGLAADDVLILFGAVIADMPGKGFADLKAVLGRVARPGVGFVAVGRLDDPSRFDLPNLVSTGPVTDEGTLARWYGACDIHVTASRIETLGQMPIEAGLCGTPTVAYVVGGLTDAVIDGVSGLLVPPVPERLAAALAALIADAPRRRRLGAFARLAFEGRNSHASAAIRLHDLFVEQGWLLPPPDGRIRFAPEMLGRFAFAKRRDPGDAGTVAPASPAAVRQLRRAKQALLGRGMPIWMRRALYVAALFRRRVGRGR
ncbi:D-inositol-3-phosphate glycosyltransferase [Methylobacterium iners]|uniref:D-inositol-3-phosphate glycosyltransferase n=1 Tax=Methylobacterium iners TaxID=418707 RepID=A0ABQ4RY38_9HYPH|nr:D-inositol-3-phosphate glycosyltransferase [Methylobacterium iners]